MDFSWSEMLLVGIVALIVIGPKDLPGMFRELGRFTAKIRAMGREFSRAMEQAAKESGVKEAADGLRAVSNPVGTGLDAVKSAADRFEKWDPIKNAAVPAKPLTPPPMPPVAKPAVAAVAEATPAATVAATVAETVTGPNTAALAERMAARKAAAVEAANLLRASGDPAATATPTAAPPVRRAGRVRKKADTTTGDPE